MDPATIIVESSKPSPRINPVDLPWTPSVASAIHASSVMLTLGKLSSFFRLLQGEIARASGNYTELRSSVEYF
jgi:hypothetical protein